VVIRRQPAQDRRTGPDLAEKGQPPNCFHEPEDLLPAILISTVNPHRFSEIRSIDKDGPFKPRERVVLISLRQQRSSRDETFGLLQKVIADIKARRELREFEVSKDKKTKFLDALILQPNISGVGIDFNRVIAFFRGK
jgi:hypothetical protein